MTPSSLPELIRRKVLSLVNKRDLKRSRFEQGGAGQEWGMICLVG